MSTEKDISNLKNIIHLYKTVCAELQRRIDRMPEGKLYVLRDRKRISYYSADEDGKRRYLKSGDSLISALARKEYYNHLQSLLDEEAVVLEKAAGKLQSIRKRYEKKKPSAEKMKFAGEFRMTEVLKSEWNNVRSEDEEHSIQTDKGDYVRSKSEALIANKLYRAGVPYIYEKMLLHQGTVLYPDFYILNMRTGDKIIWEHLGMMGESVYAEKNIKKINDYIKAGQVLGKTLLLTMESGGKGLDVAVLEKMIEDTCI